MRLVLSTIGWTLGGTLVLLLVGLGFGLFRKKLRVRIEIGSERTRIIDEANTMLLDLLNTVSVYSHGRKKVMATCGLDKKDQPRCASADLIDLVKDAQSVPPAELQELWAGFLVFCCARVTRQVSIWPAFLSAKVGVNTGLANLDEVIATVLSTRWFRARGQFTVSSPQRVRR
jgi:hypothetical protein